MSSHEKVAEGFARYHMRVNEQKRPMPKEISALNTLCLLRYLQKYHSSLDLEKLVDSIVQSSPCFVENLQNGVLEKVSLLHLQNPRYWFSHTFVKSLYDLIEKQIPDPGLGLKIGRTIYQTRPILRTALGLSLPGLHRVAGRVVKEAIRYDRTKTYFVQQLSKGIVGMQIIHDPGIVISEFGMQWNAGYFAACASLAGATNIIINLDCIDPGPNSQDDHKKAIWDITLQYWDPGLPTRLAKAFLFTLPRVRTRTEQAAITATERQGQLPDRETIARERKARLLSTQRKLRGEDRQSSKQNLHNSSRKMASTEEHRHQDIVESLHDNVTQRLTLSLSRVNSLQHSNTNSDDIEEIKDHLELALNDLRSLTSQISPPILYDFGLEAALEWLVTDINTRQDMHLLFVNLLDAPLNPEPQKKVTLYRAIRELVTNIIKHSETSEGQIILSLDDNDFVVEVEDEGIGFDPDMITQGFGLFSLQDRILHLSGKLTIDSTPGEGTVVRLSVPLEHIVHSPPTQ